jgi:hypothetical protein
LALGGVTLKKRDERQAIRDLSVWILGVHLINFRGEERLIHASEIQQAEELLDGHVAWMNGRIEAIDEVLSEGVEFGYKFVVRESALHEREE